LGDYPSMSLADARVRAQELSGSVSDVTVAFAVSEYLKVAESDFERPEQVRRRLEADVVPGLGSKRLATVTSSDITSALQKIVDRGSPVAANRTLADVRHVFDFAYQKGWVKSDPSARITRRVVGGREKSRDVVVSDEQLKALIAVMRTDRFEDRTRVASLLVLLTGCRVSEVLGISRQEVQGAWWTIPKGRMKSRKEHKVYLPYVARWLLRQVDYTLGGDHRTLSKAFRRMGVGYTPHDLRRTFATKMSDLGVMPHVIEKCLAHEMQGVMSVYNRAEFLKERKGAWLLWARFLFTCC